MKKRQLQRRSQELGLVGPEKIHNARRLVTAQRAVLYARSLKFFKGFAPPPTHKNIFHCCTARFIILYHYALKLNVLYLPVCL